MKRSLFILFLSALPHIAFSQTLDSIEQDFSLEKAWLGAFKEGVDYISEDDAYKYPVKELISACRASAITKIMKTTCKVGRKATPEKLSRCTKSVDLVLLQESADKCYRNAGFIPN